MTTHWLKHNKTNIETVFVLASKNNYICYILNHPLAVTHTKLRVSDLRLYLADLNVLGYTTKEEKIYFI